METNITNFTDIFKSSFLDQTTSFSMLDAVFAILTSFILGLFIFFIYKQTFNGVIYSHSFNISLVIMTMTTALVIMGISQNVLLSLGMVGALSIVRFRTPIKDPMDLVFLFWSIITGILAGAGLILLGVIGTLSIGLVQLLFYNRLSPDTSYLLIVKYDGDLAQTIEQNVKQVAKKAKLKSSSQISGGETEITYELRLKTANQALTKTLAELSGVRSAVMLSYDGNFTA